MEYRRALIKGGRFFFTVVTYRRKKLFKDERNIELLRESIREVKRKHAFAIDAFVLLPEHIHCIWTLPENDFDFSMRWRLIKSHFSHHCENKIDNLSDSKLRKKEKGIWQSRFWEHFIRDEKDFISQVEYIHYNPVKHGLVQAPKDWKFSSFHKYVEIGTYDHHWGEFTPIEFAKRIGSE